MRLALKEEYDNLCNIGTFGNEINLSGSHVVNILSNFNIKENNQSKKVNIFY